MSDVSTPERITADTWANLQEWARGMAQWDAGANSDVPELSPAEAEKQARRGDLLAYGFPEKYASGVDPSVGLEHAASEAALQRWMARLPEMIRDGGHLILCGGVGIGKSYACARIAEFMRQLPGNRPWYPSEISFRFAPDLAGDLLDWDAQRQSWPAACASAPKNTRQNRSRSLYPMQREGPVMFLPARSKNSGPSTAPSR